MMRVVIASDPDREELFAEIHYDEMQWAEIILEPNRGRFLLTIFPPMDRENWVFELREAEAAIAEARTALETRAYQERE